MFYFNLKHIKSSTLKTIPLNFIFWNISIISWRLMKLKKNQYISKLYQHYVGNKGSTKPEIIGPSRVRALPLAAGINVGGHYF